MRARCLGIAAIVTAAAGVLPVSAAATPAPEQTTSMEVFSPDGSIERASVTRPAADRTPAPFDAVAAVEVVPIEVNGPSESRFDLVYVGDGYTSGQLGRYGQHVRTSVSAMFEVEPFKSYRGQFNIWQVNVVSAQSGVDNDPRPGVRRDTALDMYFWCGNMERLLCVNETKARQYANAAPGVDQIVALANTTKYGGAGGGVATSSGGNQQASQIVVHELGHSVGGLADEYDYGTCDRREPREPNATTYTAAQLRAYRYKWHRWLDQPSPDGGTVGTYQGARYCRSGMYRPSQNSMMRQLGRPFNPPGREAMIAGFYAHAATIDDATALSGGHFRVAVATMPSAPRITWTVDGHPVASGVTELDVDRLGLPPGEHIVAVTVADASPQVRDEALRSQLRDTHSWRITR